MLTEHRSPPLCGFQKTLLSGMAGLFAGEGDHLRCGKQINQFIDIKKQRQQGTIF